MGDESSLSRPPEKTWAGVLYLLVVAFLPEHISKPLAGYEGRVNQAGGWVKGLFSARAKRRAEAMGAELDDGGVTVDPEDEVDAVVLREAIRTMNDALDDSAMRPLGRLLGTSLRTKTSPDGFQRSFARVLCDLSREELESARDLFAAIVSKAPAGATRVVIGEGKAGRTVVVYRGDPQHRADVEASHFRRVLTLMLSHGLLYPANVLTEDTLSAAFAEMPEIRRIRDVLAAVP